jgi:hypothetical protein
MKRTLAEVKRLHTASTTLTIRPQVHLSQNAADANVTTKGRRASSEEATE